MALNHCGTVTVGPLQTLARAHCGPGMILEIIFSLLFKRMLLFLERFCLNSALISRLKVVGHCSCESTTEDLNALFGPSESSEVCSQYMSRTKDAHLSHVGSSDIYFYRFSGLRGRLSGHITF